MKGEQILLTLSGRGFTWRKIVQDLGSMFQNTELYQSKQLFLPLKSKMKRPVKGVSKRNMSAMAAMPVQWGCGQVQWQTDVLSKVNVYCCGELM